jgi:hypothetical protein
MNTAKNFGAVLILIGIALPILSLIFVSNYNPDAGLIQNIKETEIVLILTFGVALVLTGAGVTAFSGD